MVRGWPDKVMGILKYVLAFAFLGVALIILGVGRGGFRWHHGRGNNADAREDNETFQVHSSYSFVMPAAVSDDRSSR